MRRHKLVGAIFIGVGIVTMVGGFFLSDTTASLTALTGFCLVVFSQNIGGIQPK
ncbi:hypothetical protein [Levilactobacillus lindianensis]|uniref:hypothetical protein n=1 Tax=Levilactobacillus lindianensis TaxID=2486018 RepID=UPI0013DDAD7E|nr:hypothetical protein [Levilactobacillus lindianensis]